MASNPPNDVELPVIRFKDAVGRKFSFPYNLVREWQGMKNLINEAFRHVDVLGPHVLEGHYDLTGPEGEIILPAIWHYFIKPGMSISMAMWPIDNAPRRPPFPQPPRIPPQPSGAGPPPPSGAMPGAPPFPVPSHGLGASGIRPVMVEAAAAKKPTKKKQSTMLTFLAGKPSGKTKSSKPVTDAVHHGSSEGLPDIPGWRQEVPAAHDAHGSGRPPPPFGVAPPLAGRRPQHGAVPPPPPGWNRPGMPGHASTVPDDSSNESSAESSDEDEQSSDEESITSRSAARKKGLIIHIRRQTQERKIPRRQLTVPILEPKPAAAERQEFSTARVYPDELGPGSVALELTRYNNPPGGLLSGNDGERITWLHVSRTIMDFAEFENIALYGSHLKTTSDSRVAMESLFKTVYDKWLKRSRSNWFVEPGTVIRCDVDSGGKTVASAVFASVPQIQVDSFSRSFNVKFRKGVCVPRRLHEAFNPYDTTFGRDKNQFFRKQDGSSADEILWLCETWVLIIDSDQVFTYGDPRRRSTLQENIDIRDHFTQPLDDQTVQITTPEHLQFRIPLKNCETFFKLQSSVAEQLAAAHTRLELGSDVFHGPDDFQLLDTNDEPLTAKSWSKLTKQARHNEIHVRVRWNDDDSSSSGLSTITTSYIYRVSSQHSKASSVNIVGGGVEGAEFFGIRKISTQESEAAITLPDLHPKVPPFLGWSILEANSSSETLLETGRNSTSDDDQKESIRACLLRTETALIERHHPHIADLQKRFLDLNFNRTMMQVGFENIEMQIQNLGTPRKRLNRSHSIDSEDDELSRLYKDYLAISIRALEAFVPKGHESSVLSLYYDALSKGTQYLKTPETSTVPQKWVISREPVPIPGLKYQYVTSTLVECDKCERGTIYDTPETAMAHLRGKHFSETTSEARLREYLLSLSVASDARLKKELTDLLTTSRDLMMEVTGQARNIQDGLVSGDRFRQPAQGVPYALLKALQLLIAFACTVPLLLEEIHSYYRQDVLRDGAENLALSTELREKCRFFKTTGSEISNLMKAGERALITSEESRKKEDVVKFFSSVGAHGLAMQMVSNMLQEPVYNGSSAADLYWGYLDNFSSQTIRRPSKRHIPIILSMMDETNRLAVVTKWQRKILRSLRTVLRPDTHLEPLDSLREKTFRIEGFMIDESLEKIQEQRQILKTNLEQGQSLIDVVENMTEITKDDQNRAVFVFTVVTVIFLPLSFVAAYMSMNGGPSSEDWVDTQVLFWQISAPLAVVVGVFCVSVAWQGHLRVLERQLGDPIGRLRLYFWPDAQQSEDKNDGGSSSSTSIRDD